MEPLANLYQLQARLGRDFQGLERFRAEELLKDASAKVRRISGQQISQAASSVRLTPDSWGGGYGVFLPQYPVTDVSAVVDDFGNPVDVTWQPGTNFLQTWGPVTVTYTHGYDPVPDDIVAVVCQIVGRAVTTPVDNTGVTSETLGSYSYTLGSAAAAGPLGTLNDEREIVLLYRRPSRPISMVRTASRSWPLDCWQR